MNTTELRPTTDREALRMCRQWAEQGKGYATFSAPYSTITYVTDGDQVIRMVKGPDGETLSETIV
jgi:hypothetical protein